MLITKGDLFHQQRKLKESGLQNYFSVVEVVSEKKPTVYQDIFKRHNITPASFLMVGNSLRSDVLPILDLGAWAIHLSAHLTWSHEDNPLKQIPGDRFLAVERVDQVLNALNQFKKGRE
jgi:putative hydrolase of the HAD superfamily